jgi:hypothetical protein
MHWLSTAHAAPAARLPATGKHAGNVSIILLISQLAAFMALAQAETVLALAAVPATRSVAKQIADRRASQVLASPQVLLSAKGAHFSWAVQTALAQPWHAAMLGSVVGSLAQLASSKAITDIKYAILFITFRTTRPGLRAERRVYATEPNPKTRSR